MTYKLEQDDYGGSKKVTRSIAILIKIESEGDVKPLPEDDGHIWIGSIDEDMSFRQNDHWNLTLEECRLVCQVADHIQVEGFDKEYNEAEKQKED